MIFFVFVSQIGVIWDIRY